MANEEHLSIIKKGVDAWNSWREKNPDVVPDLSGADLSWADLSAADLSGADLSEAKFRWFVFEKDDIKGARLKRYSILDSLYFRVANLHGVKLKGAVLSGAELSEADLREADLRGANLGEANLSLTDLRESDLSGADLSGADLRGADLRNANLDNAITDGTNFRGAKLTPPKRFLIEVDNNIGVEQLGDLLKSISKLHDLASFYPPRIEKIAIGHESDEPAYYDEDRQR